MSIDITYIHFFRGVKTLTKFEDALNYLHESRWADVDRFNNSHVIKRYVQWREGLPKDNSVHIAVQCDRLIVYSNTLSIFQSLLDALDEHSEETKFLYIQYKQAKQIKNYEQGVIYQKNPKHKFRIYLSAARRSLEQMHEFRDTLTRYEVVPSKSLSYWLETDHANTRLSLFFNTPGAWTWSHYSFDFDDESLITLFLLSHEEWIGKICRIEKR